MPSSRDRFTAADFRFLSELLSPDGGGEPVAGLFDDPESLREILDQKVVLDGVLSAACSISISPQFYFYVLVRHAFAGAGLEDPGLADFVAGVLAERVTADPADMLKGIPSGLTHAADFVAMMEKARGRMRFHMQLAAGNQFLVLTGLFPDYIRKRSERRGAPGIGFYESFAGRVYKDAADNPSAPRNAPRRLFGELSERMHEARCSLNRLAGELVFLGE